MFPVHPFNLSDATLLPTKTERRSQSSGKENDSEISVDSADPHPNKRQRLSDEAMACATIHLTAETSTSFVVFPHLFPTVSPLPQNCTQEALPPRFFKHIRPEQASSPSFFGEQLAEELSELSSNEEGDDAMSGTACRAFNPQKPGTPVGRAQDGFVTPTTHPEDELLGLLEGGSPEHNPQRSPSGLEKVLAALKFEDDSD